MEFTKSLKSKLDATLDLFRPTWQCSSCGKTYRRNRRSCSKCECTVFDRVP